MDKVIDRMLLQKIHILLLQIQVNFIRNIFKNKEKVPKITYDKTLSKI